MRFTAKPNGLLNSVCAECDRWVAQRELCLCGFGDVGFQGVGEGDGGLENKEEWK